ncbi:MAG: Ribonuclease [Phycisphaerae bacterium]|nr:Ribonuclease [Phycisphaerae bacterium]
MGVEFLFCGAAGEVTGSMHLIRHRDGWVALDCGLFQGRREDAERKNRKWLVEPSEIRALVLSHAHTDHTGRVPRLVAGGFDGPIYCTPATRDLCAVMLPDSAQIQMEDIQYVNKKRARQGLPPVEPLYDDKDALAAVRLMQTIPYERGFEVLPGLRAVFHEAGHMLGSAAIELHIGDGDAARTLVFSGDVGSPDKPIIRDPAPFPPADYVICESTYGGRVTESVSDAEQRITEVVRRTYERGGKVIIPAFSVGRTQTIVYFLHQKIARKELPPYPVYVDSPLAVNATEVFRMHPECYDDDAAKFQRSTGDMLGMGCCVYVQDVEESKRLHRRRKPCTIISASGMCEAGRIRHHLKNNIRNSKNTILLPGYQAENTLGRKLADGEEYVNIFHERYHVRAEVVQIHGFSAHADQSQLLKMLTPLSGRARRTFLVHGEREQSEALAGLLRERGFGEVSIPALGERIALS